MLLHKSWKSTKILQLSMIRYEQEFHKEFKRINHATCADCLVSAMSYLMWDEGPCPAAAAGWGDGLGEDQSRDFHSGSGYGEAAQTGVYFITCLTASYLIFSCRGDILFTNQREWLRMMESGCGQCCQDSAVVVQVAACCVNTGTGRALNLTTSSSQDSWSVI